MTHYVAFAGNIASGKTTCARALASAIGAELVEEAVLSNPYLEDFYADPPQWAFRLQMFNLASRSTMIMEAVDRGASIVLDRSFEEDFLFVDLAFENGFITPNEYHTYHRLHRMLLRALPQPSSLIYLEVASVDILLERIAERGRPMEQGIEGGYLESLQQRYERWIGEYAGPKERVDSISATPGRLASIITQSRPYRISETTLPPGL